MFRVESASVTYGESVHALREVTLELRPGEFTVLLGHSGAGKSTLLRMLNGLQAPTAGTITIDGRPLGDGEELRCHRLRTAMIFQLHQLIGRFTALRNVLLGRIGYYSTLRSLWPLPEDDVHLGLRCLERVGLLHKASARCDAMSGGERQRVGIARALCQQPEYVLADEPVASLDPVASERVLTNLRSICTEDGLSAVVSLHQVEYARMFAQRIVGLSGGIVVFDGTPEELDDAALARIYPDTSSSSPEGAQEDQEPQATTRRTNHGLEAHS